MVRFFSRWKFTILLALALLNVVAAPFIGGAVGLRLFINLTLTAVMVTSVMTLSRGRTLAGALALLLPCLVFLWRVYILAPAAGEQEMQVISSALQALFIAYMMVMILVQVMQAPRVSAEVISAAVVVYLFVGFLFSKLYLILELVHPGSFSLTGGDTVHTPGVWEYFSTVTLSTLGYGDMLPLTLRARSMAGGEAMVGQIYLAVLIARLVSMYRSPGNST